MPKLIFRKPDQKSGRRLPQPQAHGGVSQPKKKPNLLVEAEQRGIQACRFAKRRRFARKEEKPSRVDDSTAVSH
jgi:hypothetical protein